MQISFYFLLLLVLFIFGGCSDGDENINSSSQTTETTANSDTNSQDDSINESQDEVRYISGIVPSPVVGASVTLGNKEVFTDENGAFTIEFTPNSPITVTSGVNKLLNSEFDGYYFSHTSDNPDEYLVINYYSSIAFGLMLEQNMSREKAFEYVKNHFDYNGSFVLDNSNSQTTTKSLKNRIFQTSYTDYESCVQCANSTDPERLYNLSECQECENILSYDAYCEKCEVFGDADNCGECEYQKEQERCEAYENGDTSPEACMACLDDLASCGIDESVQTNIDELTSLDEQTMLENERDIIQNNIETAGSEELDLLGNNISLNYSDYIADGDDIVQQGLANLESENDEIAKCENIDIFKDSFYINLVKFLDFAKENDRLPTVYERGQIFPADKILEFNTFFQTTDIDSSEEVLLYLFQIILKKEINEYCYEDYQGLFSKLFSFASEPYSQYIIKKGSISDTMMSEYLTHSRIFETKLKDIPISKTMLEKAKSVTDVSSEVGLELTIYEYLKQSLENKVVDTETNTGVTEVEIGEINTGKTEIVTSEINTTQVIISKPENLEDYGIFNPHFYNTIASPETIFIDPYMIIC